jgi:pyruvate/2-oxoglutarate dehydrogenase complex dihydrolipoamide acyltransferase (E2) component
MNDDELRSSLPDPVMQAAPRALLRAAKRAREIAREMGTPLVIVRDGVLVYEDVSGDEGTAAVSAAAPAASSPPGVAARDAATAAGEDASGPQRATSPARTGRSSPR